MTTINAQTIINEAMAPVSSVAGQHHLCSRAGRIASLKMMNEQIRKIDASEAWHDSNIENETDLDSLQDRVSQCLVDLQRSKELVTCEAGESEATAQSMGSATAPAWAPFPQYVPPSLSQIKPGEPVPPAFRGGVDDIDPPSDGNAEPTPRPVESTDFSGDIPLSLAVSAFGGVSMSPDRRGLSAKNEYGQSMAADYETLHAQAVKGGTLDLLPEVFARYRARQAGSYKAYLSSSSRCVSSFIAGPSNFPAARMNKRADIAHKRLTEYLDGGKMALQAAIRTLRPDLRAIMAGDADAIDRLTVKIEAAERAQAQMKAANKAIRANAKQGEAHQVAALMELGYREDVALSLLHPQFAYQGQGFPSYSLTNNNANIRRMKERLEQISKAQAQEVQAVECANGVTLEDDAPANRVRLFFPGKPSEAIRDELKASGFRWAPSVGAWQAYRNYGTLATAKRMAGEPVKAEENSQDAAPEAEIVAEVEIVAPSPVMESAEAPMAPVAEVLTEAKPAYTLPTKSPYDDWARHQCADFAPDARQQMVIDAVQIALNEKLFYAVDVLARCIVLLNIDAATQAIKTERVEGGDVGMDVYYARRCFEAKKAHEAAATIHAEMDLKVGDELGILVFTDYKRTTGVKITEANGLEFTFTGKRGAVSVQGKGIATRIKNAIDRAFATGKRKTDYAAFLAAQAKRTAPTPAPVESQPEAVAPAVEAAQDAPAVDANEWGPAIGETYIGAVEYAVQEANRRGDGFEYRTGENALMERRKLPAVTQASAATQTAPAAPTTPVATSTPGTPVAVSSAAKTTKARNGRMVLAKEYHGELYPMTYANRAQAYAAAEKHGGVVLAGHPFLVALDMKESEPTPTPAVSSAPKHRRNIVPDNGLQIVEDAFEAWTFTSGARFAFVMYLGKSAKPWKYYGYPTEAKRDAGFERYATDARAILALKAKRKQESKGRIDAGHGLQVGDVVRSSWGYDQTNVNHYQVTAVIGKRTVEVRELNEHHESTGDMTGRASPIWGDFAGKPMRRQVDQYGQVNMLSASYGRASKIEPLAIVHGVRCYAATSYSSYA